VGEVNCVERGQIPLMDGTALSEEVILLGSLADVVFVVSGDSCRANAELGFGGWDKGGVFLNGRGVAEVESTGGFVGIYIELSGG
jgi:hypothetical protein